MADETTRVIVSQIDAPLPEEWRQDLEGFTKEIAAVREVLDVMNVSTAVSAEASKALVDMYTKESVAERASQTILQEQPAGLLDRYGNPMNGFGSSASQASTAAGGGPPTGNRPAEVFNSPEPGPESPHYQGGPSRPPNAPTAQEEKEEKREEFLNQPVEVAAHMGGHYTAQDFLRLMGQGARKVGAGGIANAAAGLGETMPKLEALSELGRSYGGKIVGMGQGLQSYSASIGNQPGQGGLGANSTISLPFGLGNFRNPLSDSTIAGAFGQGGLSSAYWEAMHTPGLTGSENASMYQALAEKGYYPGEKGFNEIHGAQTKLFEKGGPLQELATNPDVMEMMDKGFRTGSKSIKEITEMVEEIPEAAKTAHVGMTQMMADMKTFGEVSEAQGGTTFGGAEQALQLAAATGQPASASLGMVNNQWAQAKLYRETGLPSYMQGVLPAQVKNRYATEALQQARQLVGKRKAIHTYNPVSGTYETTSAVSQEAAAIKAIVPGYENMSIEQIERHLRGGGNLAGGEENREQTLGATKQWKKDAEQMYKEHPNSEAINNFISGGEPGQGKGAFGHILSQMRNQMTADGRHRYSQGDIKEIREAGKGMHGDELIEAKYNEINKIIEEKASKQSRNQEGEAVTIGLSPAAKRFLTVESRRSRAKREAGAGGSEPTNHSFTGASDPLPPNTVNPNEYRAFGSDVQGGHGKS